MRKIGEHAVVLGAGIGGLLAARVLSEAYSTVTVIERDALAPDSEARKGVPQGRHVHGLLPRGKDIIEELFPGFGQDLRTSGVVECDALREVSFTMAGRTLKRVSTGHKAFQASRPHLEHHLRRRVEKLSNVTIRDRCDAGAPVVSADGARITGVRIVDRSDGARETIDADLVVASMGRAGVVPSWLDKLGYDRPAEEGTAIDIVYRSAVIQLPPHALPHDKLVTIGVRDLPPRALALFAVEGDRHILTLIGHDGEEPPKDQAGFLDFAAGIAPPDVLAALADGELLGDISTFRYKANLRRRYERLDRFPEGLLAVGDSLCSFSPVYGQGMTVAAIQMAVLRECLAQGDKNLAARFYTAVTPEIDNAWLLTVIADGAMPHVSASASLPVRAAVAALDPVLIAAERDTAVATTLYRVMGLVDKPSALFSPVIVARIGIANARAAVESLGGLLAANRK
ncbi:FAD-dependent oxidoreductase [Nocardia alba]|uniref:2-polyprenyl-6-methoxyphenol hydroxylase-like FAD-dependent oxidoreductase n=1 Tax=Nocardia alba TaxID=225051 RepID=A0A4R1FQ54_9NOCA|nr:FAD-dependent monooxygenase [Nocardia alba]TCJ96997.1 2-polyprenyl-6-methoxyphenol hydroxylase-like FAD-dependent oxidoreductase [Nocardia alba]